MLYPFQYQNLKPGRDFKPFQARVNKLALPHCEVLRDLLHLHHAPSLCEVVLLLLLRVLLLLLRGILLLHVLIVHVVAAVVDGVHAGRVHILDLRSCRRRGCVLLGPPLRALRLSVDARRAPEVKLYARAGKNERRVVVRGCLGATTGGTCVTGNFVVGRMEVLIADADADADADARFLGFCKAGAKS